MLAGLLVSRTWTFHLPGLMSLGPFRALFGRLLRSRSLSALGVLGVLNGLLPCGLVYVACAAAAATGEGVWVEKVRFRTRPEMDWGKLKSGTEPLSDLIRYIDGLKTNEEVKNWVEEDLKILKGKLPPEIFQDGGVIDPGSGEALKDVLEDVKGMLVHRILETESRK